MLDGSPGPVVRTVQWGEVLLGRLRATDEAPVAERVAADHLVHADVGAARRTAEPIFRRHADDPVPGDRR